MGFDALASAAAATATSAAVPKDIAGASRKKRGNRSAKLKQCKLDARREQWISQVNNKNKGASMAASPTSPLPPPPISLPTGQSYEYFKNDHEGSDSESPSDSPASSGDGHGVSSGESSYRSQSEDGGGENEALDDWEAVADALFADCGNQDQEPDPAPATPEKPTDQAPAMQEPVRSAPAPRAWKPDDAARPRSLPSLLKQRSCMVVMERQCGLPHTSSPTMCPICCEDLDVTDSSFLPCLCGFRLCLFCYKRILEEDGRCPGCRKQYDPVAGGAMDGGGGDEVSLKLSRSRSMSPRS